MRHRHSIATVRTSAVVAATLALTVAVELLVLLTAGRRADGSGVLEAALTTLALAACPPITAGFALLWLRRSVPHYRRLLSETCFWVTACNAIVALLALSR